MALPTVGNFHASHAVECRFVINVEPRIELDTPLRQLTHCFRSVSLKHEARSVRGGSPSHVQWSLVNEHYIFDIFLREVIGRAAPDDACANYHDVRVALHRALLSMTTTI